jgi:ADP-ribose pyrophosphatase
MHTIVIGDGLTNDVLSPEERFQTCKSHVGRREVDRLVGKGKAFGEGPLPVFLRCAVEARSKGNDIGLVLLKNTGPSAETSQETQPSEFIDPLQEVAQEAVVIPVGPDVVPWRQLAEAIALVVGGEPSLTGAHDQPIRFLIVGCHTDRRVLAAASFLKNVLGYPEVAVSSHLVGSATQEAHFAALRHNLPSAGIDVLLDLEETASFAGLEPGGFEHFACRPCAIEPDEARSALGEQQKRIIEVLCMHWTRAELRPLAGGFSGSLLFLADGWKGEARTEPMVLKIDDFLQMRRELQGYHQIKDFFGKHVPTFGYPVTMGDSIGVGMELAAMEGSPETLQDTFEEAEGEDELSRFMLRFDKTLALLSDKLYRNTKETAWVVPYRAFLLHTKQQLEWLQENVAFIMSYHEAEASEVPDVDPDSLANILRLIAANEDGIDSEVCLSHGDLNLANVICDERDNIWFIDWTHGGQAPVELDFAKLENDVKFVISKEFDVDDLPRIKQFEEYLLAQPVPADANSLPDSLKFSKWDLRFRKMLGAVRRIRQACFALKESDDWLVYRIALLKFAVHTLSFDKRRGRGECDLPQLMHVLYSVWGLVFDLVADDFHLRIRSERPPSYPPRQRLSIDEAPWIMECSQYDPPYHVDPSVLDNDRTRTPGGWADPEDFAQMRDDDSVRSAKHKDDAGRPLNPHGRTGIAGRGLLGRWGTNLAVAAIASRANRDAGHVEILLGQKEGHPDLTIPKGFVLPDETPEEAMARVLEVETGWRPEAEAGDSVSEGYTYDPRQTDHAWVETRAYLFYQGAEAARGTLQAGGEFDEVKWRPLDAETVNSMPSSQARFIREAVKKLMETGCLETSEAERLLAKTG